MYHLVRQLTASWASLGKTHLQSHRPESSGNTALIWIIMELSTERHCRCSKSCTFTISLNLYTLRLAYYHRIFCIKGSTESLRQGEASSWTVSGSCKEVHRLWGKESRPPQEMLHPQLPRGECCLPNVFTTYGTHCPKFFQILTFSCFAWPFPPPLAQPLIPRHTIDLSIYL